jgi:hypothetical protein
MILAHIKVMHSVLALKLDVTSLDRSHGKQVLALVMDGILAIPAQWHQSTLHAMHCPTKAPSYWREAIVEHYCCCCCPATTAPTVAAP